MVEITVGHYNNWGWYVIEEHSGYIGAALHNKKHDHIREQDAIRNAQKLASKYEADGKAVKKVGFS